MMTTTMIKNKSNLPLINLRKNSLLLLLNLPLSQYLLDRIKTSLKNHLQKPSQNHNLLFSNQNLQKKICLQILNPQKK